MSEVNYYVNDIKFTYKVEGVFETGEDVLLIENDQNLLLNTEWENEGFVVTSFLSENQSEILKNEIFQFIKTLILKQNVAIDDNFKLENYHLYVDDEKHNKLISEIKDGWNCNLIPGFDFNIINDRISEIIGTKIKSSPKEYEGNHFCIRIVRPQKKQDNNPPHRDVWLDRLRNAINIYFPICGSNIKSSLPIMPKSHYLKENQILRTKSGANIDNISYTVPCALSVDDQSIKMITPNPKSDELLLFLPYLIHGGAFNMNLDVTRVSLEMRFWKD